jgi:DnaJ-domain-containing protein 1
LDNFFDRMGDFLKSVIITPSGTDGYSNTGDPDLDEAWAELDAYIKTGEEPPKKKTKSKTYKNYSGRRYENDPVRHLRKDFARLELPFGAPMDAVRQSYKKMLVRYHPDRWSSNTEKMALATEITKKITESFRRINEYYGK